MFCGNAETNLLLEIYSVKKTIYSLRIFVGYYKDFPYGYSPAVARLDSATCQVHLIR